MRRRRLLAALGASTLSLSGCVGSDALETTTAEPSTKSTEPETRTSTPEDERTTTDGSTPTGLTVTVHSLDVRRSVVVQGVHLDPYYRPDEQFVVADASVGSRDDRVSDAAADAFAVVADDERVDTATYYPVDPLSEDPEGTRFSFVVPAPLEADGASVVWNGVDGSDETRWSLDDVLLDALANPPAFDVRRFEVPDEVNRGSSFETTLAVENTGSGDGTFLAELGATTVSDTSEVRVEVPEGETVTATRTMEPHYPEETDELTVRLNWGSTALTRTVAVT